MPGNYIVRVAGTDEETAGPVSLKAAKDNARIASQHGQPRAVHRLSDDTVVRIYRDGERLFPVACMELDGLTRYERPKHLDPRGRKTGPCSKA